MGPEVGPPIEEKENTVSDVDKDNCIILSVCLETYLWVLDLALQLEALLAQLKAVRLE